MDQLDSDIQNLLRLVYPHVESLNPAQRAVIDGGYLEDEDNFIVCIPTASGKTLLGMIAALKTILNGGKVVYAVPLLSIQNEKVKEFKSFEEEGISVGTDPKYSDLSVMVFESFDSLTQFSWNNLHDIDLLIVDEFHMIGEYSRGPTIECAITRARIINHDMRIIVLSATLQNIEEICGWLDAKVVEHDYRPVPLHKEVLNTEMFNTSNKNDVIVKILEKTMQDDSQALGFVSTRLFTESLAGYLSNKIKVPKDKKNEFSRISEEILEVPKSKGSRPTSVCVKLSESVSNGVAFHHAGLFTEQKEIIEDEFRSGNIMMIIATPSLMYGVNLPCRDVVIRDYTRWTNQGRQNIPVFDYEQMSGRAGRPQYDNEGFSYLIAKTLEEAYSLQEYYIEGEVEPTTSKLIENKNSVYKQIISQIVSKLSNSPEDIQGFFEKTFYGYQLSNNPYYSSFSEDSLKYEVDTSISFLIDNGIIRATPEGFKATDFGLLIAKTNYTVETSIKLKEYILQMDGFDEVQILYQIANTPDMPLISIKSRKSKDPVREKLTSNGIFCMDVNSPETTTASLIEWINEFNEYEIENSLNVYSASIRRSAYETSNIVKFFKDICEVVGVYSYSQDLNILAGRLYYGVKEELIPLVLGVKRLGRKRARNIFNVFGEDLRPYSEKELEKIDGIGPKLAKSIVEYVKED